MKIYRVECNHGSKYFSRGVAAFAYFNKQKAKRFDVEIWLVTYTKTTKLFMAEQELLEFYSPA